MKLALIVVLFAFIVFATSCTRAGFENIQETPLIIDGSIAVNESGVPIMIKSAVKADYVYWLQNKENMVDLNSDGNPDLTTRNSSDPAVEAFRAGIETGKAWAK